MEPSRCLPHTSHVAVVDLPPLSLFPSLHQSIHPLFLTPLSGCRQCFSAWRQTFTQACVSSSCSSYSLHLLNIYKFTSDWLWQFVACCFRSIYLPNRDIQLSENVATQETAGNEVEPVVFCHKVPVTQHLCREKRSVSEDLQFEILAVTSQVHSRNADTTHCRKYLSHLSYLRRARVIQGCYGGWFYQCRGIIKTFFGMIWSESRAGTKIRQ